MRVLAMGDFHCGHLVGLTPPDWQVNKPSKRSVGEVQKMLWAEFTGMMKGLRKPDLLILNGDLIDGRGEKSAGTELITTSLEEQCMISEDVIKYVNPKKIKMTFGTPYHCGRKEDEENRIMRGVGADSIEGHAFIDVRGTLFDVKHKVGSSGIPHGRANAIMKEKLWSDQWALHDGAPVADIVLRSHVHYHTYAGNPDFLAMTLPSLQGPGSKYGIRECSGLIHFGLVEFNFDTKGRYTWHAHTVKVTDRKKKIQYVR